MSEARRTSPDPLPFLKMHGLGNDFVVIDARAGGGDPVTPALARAIGDRHRGVGFDQLAVILPAEDADARLVFWNADGSTAGACGNATRCVAERLMTEARAEALTLRTERGLLACARRGDAIEVDMGAPLTGWAEVPLAREVDTRALPLPGAPAACSMGNPHCTFFTEDAGAADLAAIGARTEVDPLFPERTNVQIVEILARDRARVRVWERGVGPTLASGSSSCAVLVNAVRLGLMDRRATLILDGGEIGVAWPEGGGVRMTGPTALVFEGALAPDFLEAAT